MIQVILNMPPDFILIGGTPAEQVLKELSDFAAKEENWLTPDKTLDLEAEESKKYGRHVEVKCAAGHDHTMHVLFTFTVGVLTNGNETQEAVLRHTTIAVDDHRAFPDPVQIFTVCKFLGFTGSVDDWHIEAHPGIDHAVTVVQPIDSLGGRKVEFSMYFNKGGKEPGEPRSVQHEDGDLKGKATSDKLMELIHLRVALEKTGHVEEKQIKELVNFYNGKPMSNDEPIALFPLFEKVPLDLTEEEKDVFTELRKRLLGY